MTDTSPVGIFDSGLGGLTVLKAVNELLPRESTVYFGDTARVPYGTKSSQTIIQFSEENSDFLISKGVKCIVVACHTASSLAMQALKDSLALPVLGVVEPAALAAARQSPGGRIGIVGTRSTIKSGAFHTAIRKHNPEAVITESACGLLVPFIEEGWREEAELESVLEKYLKPLIYAEVDTVILGCTHYPILTDLFKKILPEETVLVNPAYETAAALKQLLQESGLADETADKKESFYVSDEPEAFGQMGAKFLGREIGQVLKAVHTQGERV